jgi:hypothetical protein
VYVKGNRPNGSVRASECFQASQEPSAKATATSPRKSPNPPATATAARFGDPAAAPRGQSPAPSLDGASPRLGGTFLLTMRRFDISCVRYIVVAREPMGGERGGESAMSIFDFQRREGAVVDGPSARGFARRQLAPFRAFSYNVMTEPFGPCLRGRAFASICHPTDRTVRSDPGVS